MTVNKGLASLIDTDPSLSNQAQENAINDDDKQVLMDKIIETEKENKDE